MLKLRALVVEDEAPYQKFLREILEKIPMTVDVAGTYDDALVRIENTAYDLITFDLFLPETSLTQIAASDPQGEAAAIAYGEELMKAVRQSKPNSHAATIVVTGRGDWGKIVDAFKKHSVDDFFDKGLGDKATNTPGFEEGKFIESVQQAVLNSLIKRAEQHTREQLYLIVEFDLNSISRTWLRNRTDPHNTAIAVNGADLIRRADNLNMLIFEKGPEVWRPEARSVGDTLYQSLKSHSSFSNNFQIGKSEIAHRHSRTMQIVFRGPPEGIGMPFELLYNNEYLLLEHPISRYIVRQDEPVTPAQRFYEFLRECRAKGKQIRVLVVGANSDGNIPAAEQEAIEVAENLRRISTQLGIKPQLDVRLFVGADATHQRIVDELNTGSYHFFHYAGHGRHNDKLPEISGLVLSGGMLTAADLRIILRKNEEMQFVYLSCCLSARTATSPQHGDYHGVFDALVRAQVKAVLGFRWMVADEPARILATEFYNALFSTLSLEESLARARDHLRLSAVGRSNETWLSPLMLVQYTTLV